MTVTLRQGLAGALGGWLAFLLLEPGLHREELAGAAGNPVSLMLVGFLLGGVITFSLAVAEEAPHRRPMRMLARGVIAGIGGALFGFLFLIVAARLYRELAPLGQVGVPALQILRRTLVWGLWGAGVGLGAGLATRAQRRLLQGCVGGLAGGLAGGLIFDALPAVTGAVAVSRLVGFVGIGLSVGLATALVEQLTAVAWLQYLSGSRAGQRLYLHRDTLVLGRDELVDVPLFGDPGVAPAQAILHLTPRPVIHEVGVQPLLRVDGAACRSAQLVDGSEIEIGPHRLSFHQRDCAPDFVEDFAEGQLFPTTVSGTPPPAPADVTVMGVSPLSNEIPAARDAAGPGELQGLSLRVMAGPAEGLVVPLRTGLTLGRERDNDLSLADLRASRYHACIDFIEDSWVLSDLGSSNGTRLNGIRILRGGLQPDDFLYVGDSVFHIEESP